MTHPDDDLQLYALGDLSFEERSAVEAHLEGCVECSRIVGEAESALADMSDLIPAFRAPRRSRFRPNFWRGAIAAALIVGMILAGGTVALIRQAQGRNDDVRAQVAMTNSHFNHVQLDPVAAGAPAAKVIYARDKSWLYAIVDDGHEPFRLVAVDFAGRHDLGTLAGHGITSSLFVEKTPEVKQVELLSGDRVIARGMLK